MEKMVFATNNEHKLREVREILGESRFRLVTLRECGITEDIPENEPTIEGNALAKARYVYLRTGLDCFADDTGLEVAALGGAPGVRSARYAADNQASCSTKDHDFDANTALLLHNLAGKEDRSARFRTVIALIKDGHEQTFEGIINGCIIEASAGGAGFGYDPVFIPDGYTETFAQMPPELKNAISHRGIAVRKLVDKLTIDND
jgi:XTP/dITP diphosphohydrolase